MKFNNSKMPIPSFKALPLMLLGTLVVSPMLQAESKSEPQPNIKPESSRVQFQGKFEQGALIRARTEPGTEVQLNGESITLTPDGRFAFGFEREAALEQTLTLSSRMAAVRAVASNSTNGIIAFSTLRGSARKS